MDEDGHGVEEVSAVEVDMASELRRQKEAAEAAEEEEANMRGGGGQRVPCTQQ